MLRRRPALRLAILLSGGILAAQIAAVPPLWTLLVLACLFALALILRSRTSSHVLLQFCVVILGFHLTAMEHRETHLRRLPDTLVGDTLRVDGMLEEDPRPRGKTIQMVIACDWLKAGGGIPDERRRLIVYASARDFPGLPDHWEAGSLVAVRGVVEPFPGPHNPGEFDYGRYLTLNEIDGILWLADTAKAEGGAGSMSVRIWFTKLRSRFGGILEKFHGPLQSSFLRGVLLGDRSGIPTEVKESFMIAGTIHILAVSGAHGAVIAAALYIVLGLFRLPRRWVILLTIAGLVFFMMLTGAPASIVRATIMTAVVLGGRLLERKTDIYNSIAVAALITLLWSPSQLLNVGFQLSFAAVLSIVSIYPRLDLLIRKIPARFEEIKAIDYVLKLFAVSFAAQLGTLPFTAYYFERFSIISLLANLIVVPLVGVNLILGCITLLASAAGTWIAASYAALNELLVTFLLGFVNAAASVPFASVETVGFTFGSAVLYYVCLIGILHINNPTVIKRSVALILFLLNLHLYLQLFSSSSFLTITALDVGQGDALVIRFPNGTTMMIDAGPKTLADDAGKRVVVPYLLRNGISRIEALVASHPHSDHIGGMPYLLTKMTVDTLYEADTLTASRLHGLLRRELAEYGVGWSQLRSGREISPDPSVRVYCLGPSPSGTVSNLNDRSVVLKIVYGSTSAILPGDAERGEEDGIVSRYGAFLVTELLKAGHHGSSTSSSEEFLHGMSANFAIISVGTNNKFRHPSPVVVARMQKMGMEVLRTDREGAIVFESDGTSWKRIRWRTEGP